LTLREKYKDDTALVTLVNDILAYGSAASEYKGYGSMTDDYVSSDREIPTTNVAPSDAFTGYTVKFGTSNGIIIQVDPNAFSNNIYQVYCNGDVIGNYKHPNSNQYAIYNISPTDFDKKYEFIVKSNNPNGSVYGSIAISINDYLYSISQSATSTAEMKALAKALYNYGMSAEEYARPIINLTQYADGETIDITQSSKIIGDGTEYNLSLNIAEDVTVVFDEGTGGVKLNAITVADNKTLTLQVKGNVEHIVKEGISIGNGSNVIIEGERDKENNKLTVTATDGNAGIGANNGVTAGDITIRNARVDATGGGSSDGSGAAIGTSDASMGNILIENSIVTAAGGYYNSDDFMEISHAAAIGMGYYGGTMGNITLKDSEITASNNGDGLASVIGAGSQNKEGDNNAGTLGDIIITNTDLNLSMVIGTEICYAAVIGPGMGYSFAWTNMGKIIFTDMTQEQLDAIIPTWLPSDFNEWGAYALGRGYDGCAYKKETFGGVWVSDGNGDTVQIGNENGYYCLNEAKQ
jgi:hypothetical protein